MHRISLISTLPYVAKDSLKKEGKLYFMDVISILSLMYGDSPEWIKETTYVQFLFYNHDALFGYEEDLGNEKEQEAPIKDNESEDEPSVVNLKMQRESTPPKEEKSQAILMHVCYHKLEKTQLQLLIQGQRGTWQVLLNHQLKKTQLQLLIQKQGGTWQGQVLLLPRQRQMTQV
jgi:hypothetical protein